MGFTISHFPSPHNICLWSPLFHAPCPTLGVLAYSTASLTVIAARAVSGMLTASVADPTQLTYPIFYIMLIIMVASCICQVK